MTYVQADNMKMYPNPLIYVTKQWFISFPEMEGPRIVSRVKRVRSPLFKVKGMLESEEVFPPDFTKSVKAYTSEVKLLRPIPLYMIHSSTGKLLTGITPDLVEGEMIIFHDYFWPRDLVEIYCKIKHHPAFQDVGKMRKRIKEAIQREFGLKKWKIEDLVELIEERKIFV